ncbi:MAG: glycosyltransferase [Taibaiella sp.]|jgi:glycosyltransferase involved in cell wall biosynthesis
MANSLVSIVVVSYNHAKYLVECLDSILGQTYKNWELIVVDDASADNSVKVYNDWLEQNNVVAKKIYNKQNKGLIKTLNSSISHCSGIYIKLFAADDVMHEELLSACVSKFEEDDDDLGIIFSNAQFINEHSEKLEQYLLPEKVVDGWIFEKLMAGNFIAALTAMIKAEVYKKVGNYDEEIWIEDWEFWLRAAQCYKFAYISASLAYYRMHSSNISADKPKMAKGEWDILMKYDKEGKYRKSVNNFVRDRFFNVSNKKEMLQLYSIYPYKSNVLYLFLKLGMPRKFYRLYQLVFKQ